MKYNLIALTCAFLLAAGLSLTVTAGPLPDTDGDTIADVFDNCLNVSNTNQKDADNDGYGQVCDADFDGNGNVVLADYATFKGHFSATCTVAQEPACVADLDCSNRVVLADFATFKGLFGKPVGPSGCKATSTCSGSPCF